MLAVAVGDDEPVHAVSVGCGVVVWIEAGVVVGIVDDGGVVVGVGVLRDRGRSGRQDTGGDDGAEGQRRHEGPAANRLAGRGGVGDGTGADGADSRGRGHWQMPFR